MKKTILAFAVLLSLATLAVAQDEPYESFIGLGSGIVYFDEVQPYGTVLYGHRLTGGLYSISAADFISKTPGDFQFSLSLSTGLAQQVARIGNVRLYTFGTVGAAAGSGNAGGSWSGGGGILIPIKKGWSLFGTARAFDTAVSTVRGIYSLQVVWGK